MDAKPEPGLDIGRRDFGQRHPDDHALALAMIEEAIVIEQAGKLAVGEHLGESGVPLVNENGLAAHNAEELRQRFPLHAEAIHWRRSEMLAPHSPYPAKEIPHRIAESGLVDGVDRCG